MGLDARFALEEASGGYMSHGQWWQRPQLIVESEGGGERKVSWLELFFDLIFVIVITESTVKMHLKHLYGKLDVHTRLQAVVQAQALELID
jgi:low temperature requirement protein LtrA